MPGFALRTNTVFDWEGASFRIERLPPDGNVLLERVSDGNMKLLTRDELLTAYSQGKISSGLSGAGDRPSLRPTFSRPLSDLSPKAQQEARRRLAYMAALYEQGDFVFTKEYLTPLIKQVAVKIGDNSPPSTTTIYRWTSRYRISKDARSLVPRTDLRGSRNLRQGNEILEYATEAIQEAFDASPRATAGMIFTRLVGKIKAENFRRIPEDALKIPSLRTVYRMLGRVEAYDQVVLREGKIAADKRFRITKRGVVVTRILERVEMDHTPLDLFLIDERSWLPLGRPILTIIIDCYSRMLLGYFLCFEGPSTMAVMAALRHAVLPKVPVAEAVPGLKVEHSWPCYGRPKLLVVDNGMEFHGDDLDSVAFDLHCNIEFCPKHQPWFKGVVERYLGTINNSFARQIPGTSFARLHLRGDYDPQKHAVLTLAEFKHLFEKWVLDVYAQQLHRGIRTTPWAKWHEGLSHHAPELPEDLQHLQRRIGLVRERSLRRDGIWLNGIAYNSEVLQPILRAFGVGIRVRVLYDPEDLGAIQVWGPSDEVPVTVPAVDQVFASGLTARQNALIRERLRAQGAAAEDRESLQRAKHQIATSIQELMSSRKQRQRRQAAALRGMTSNKPDARPAEVSVPPPPKRVKPKPTALPTDQAPDLPPMPAYSAFQLKR